LSTYQVVSLTSPLLPFSSYSLLFRFFLFFFNDTATTEIYTLSLHDALPIYLPRRSSTFSATAPTTSARSLKSSTTSPSKPTYWLDRKSTRLNSSHVAISYAVFCLKKKKKKQ